MSVHPENQRSTTLSQASRGLTPPPCAALHLPTNHSSPKDARRGRVAGGKRRGCGRGGRVPAIPPTEIARMRLCPCFAPAGAVLGRQDRRPEKSLRRRSEKPSSRCRGLPSPPRQPRPFHADGRPSIRG